MPRMKKTPEPAAHNEICDLQDKLREERAVLADLYAAARRRCDTAECTRLWEY